LFGVHLTTVRSDIEDTVDNPDDFVREYMWEVTDFLKWWRWGTWSRRVNQNYRRVYNEFKNKYTSNSLSRAFTDYERHIFKDSNYWFNYNRRERDYLTMRSRLNASKSVYPVYDLWWVWASTGISKWTSPTSRRIKAKKLELPKPPTRKWDERRWFELAEWWEAEVKASKIRVE
jgi:hypothetical protein